MKHAIIAGSLIIGSVSACGPTGAKKAASSVGTSDITGSLPGATSTSPSNNAADGSGNCDAGVAVAGAPVVSSLSPTPARATKSYSYDTDIKPLLAANCNSCHGTGFGAQAPKLTDDATALQFAAAIAKDVAGGTMPLGKTLDQATKDLFAAWAGSGYPASKSGASAALTDAGGCLTSSLGSGTAASNKPAPFTGMPQSVADMVSLVNSLPMPVSLADVIRALPHPLTVSATTSTVSLQPAAGDSNPRMFIILGPMVLAVVPVGTASSQLEIAVRHVDPGVALANTFASINFPVTTALKPETPYATVLNNTGVGGASTCSGALCHVNETAKEKVGGVQVFHLNEIAPALQTVKLASLLNLASSCTDKTARCSLFQAMFPANTGTEYQWPADEVSGTTGDFFSNLPTIIPGLFSGQKK